MGRGLVAVALVLLAAGCASPSPPGPPPDEGAPAIVHPASVVVADTGGTPNFYHEAHRRPGWTEHPSTRIPGFPADAPALPLTFAPTLDASLQADAPTWAALQPGLYWVPGTNLLFDHHGVHASEEPPPKAYTHGAGTTGAVSDACPDCYVLVVRHPEAHLAAGVLVVAERHPWVDVVVQTGALGSSREFPEATRTLVGSGRPFIGPSGNTPVAGTRAGSAEVHDGANGPPWIVSVAGSNGACRSVTASSGTPTDVVSEFDQRAPSPDSTTERVLVQGTSFAAPRVAGLMGLALLEVRRALGSAREPGTLWSGEPRPSAFLEDGALTHDELRFAMERSAGWFATTEFDPACAAPPAGPWTPAPAPPAPWTKMGWGHVDEESALRAARVLLGEEPVPDRGAEAEAWMDAAMDARRQRYPE